MARSRAGTPSENEHPETAEPNRNPIPRKLLDAPNTHIFSLASIRTKLGSRWEQYGPSVHRIANRLLFNNLDGKGSFERFGDAYVLTFDHLRGEPARQKGERLFNQFVKLLEKGTGSDNLKKAPEKKANAGEGRAGKRGGFLRRAFRRLKGFFGNDNVGSPSKSGSEDSNAPSTTDGQADTSDSNTQTRGRRHFAPGPQTANNASGRRFAAKRFKAPLNDPSDPDAGWRSPPEAQKLSENLKLLREARTIESAIAIAVLRRQAEWSTDMDNRDFPPPDLNFIYRSMWNLRSRHLTTYTSVPICWKSSMEVHHGEDVVPPPRRANALFDLDILCLENTIEILDQLMKKKRQVLFMNVVHASTLANKEMMAEFLAVAEPIPQAARRQLIFEIVDIGDYAHLSDTIQMVRNLSPYARAITASVGLQDQSFGFWKQCGFMGVGADLSRDLRLEEEIIANMTGFVAQAKRNKLVSYLRELDKFSLTISAAGVGFDFLEGAVIGSSDDPDNLALSEFNIENLYEDAAEMVWTD